VYVLLEFWKKNNGNPYYEPTIVVHDTIEYISTANSKISSIVHT